MTKNKNNRYENPEKNLENCTFFFTKCLKEVKVKGGKKNNFFEYIRKPIDTQHIEYEAAAGSDGIGPKSKLIGENECLPHLRPK